MKNIRRRNPLSETILRTLPAEAVQAVASGRPWELRPSDTGSFSSWAMQDSDQDGVWARVWFVPGFRVEDGSLLRTIWRFDDESNSECVAAFPVDDDEFFTVMEGYGEEPRTETWRDYLVWVIQNERDPLDELKVEGNDGPSAENWAVALQDHDRGGRTIAVELAGARREGESGPLLFPDALPKELLRVLEASKDSSGVWFCGNWRSLAEIVPYLENGGVRTDKAAPGFWRGTVRIRTAGASAATPRSETLREAAKLKFRELAGMMENPPRARRAKRWVAGFKRRGPGRIQWVGCRARSQGEASEKLRRMATQGYGGSAAGYLLYAGPFEEGTRSFGGSAEPSRYRLARTLAIQNKKKNGDFDTFGEYGRGARHERPPLERLDLPRGFRVTDTSKCPYCGGRPELIGSLGSTTWFRCSACGRDFMGPRART